MRLLEGISNLQTLCCPRTEDICVFYEERSGGIACKAGVIEKCSYSAKPNVAIDGAVVRRCWGCFGRRSEYVLQIGNGDGLSLTEVGIS